jgi:hypothetical protein
LVRVLIIVSSLELSMVTKCCPLARRGIQALDAENPEVAQEGYRGVKGDEMPVSGPDSTDAQ